MDIEKEYSDFSDWDEGFPEVPEDIMVVLKTLDKIKGNPDSYDKSSLQTLMDRCLWFGSWLLYDYLKRDNYEQINSNGNLQKRYEEDLREIK